MIKADRGWWAWYRIKNPDGTRDATPLPIVGWSDCGMPLVAHPETARLVKADEVVQPAWEFQRLEYLPESSSPGAFAAPPGWSYRTYQGEILPVVGFVVREQREDANDGEGLYMTARALPIVVGADGQAHEAAHVTGAVLIPPPAPAEA